MTTPKLINPLETPKKIGWLTDKFYRELRESPQQGRKVAWLIGPVQQEPLRAMGISFLHTENYGARVAARGVARFFQQIAENWGLSKEACSFLRSVQGMSLCYAQDVDAPPEIREYWVPKPDMVIGINYCISVLNLAEILRRDLKVPVHIIEVPFPFRDRHEEKYFPYTKKIVQEYIAFLEQQTGHRMDYDKLSSILTLLKEAVGLRNEVYDMARHVPSPITVFDNVISMGAGNIWRGTQEATDYFRALKTEVQERIAKGVAAVPNERFRLAWDFIAVWARVGHMARLFASHNASVVGDLYSRILHWDTDIIDPARPVDTLALELAGSYAQMHINEKVRRIKKIVDEFSIDGIVCHNARTCRKIAIQQYPALDEIEKLTGVASVRFDADHSDDDFYSAAQIDNRIIAFLEVLEARKRKGH